MNTKMKPFICPLLLICLVLKVSLTSVYSQDRPRAEISINPQPMSLKLNESMIASLVIQSLEEKSGLSGFDICINFNPSHLSIISHSEPVDENGESKNFTKVRADINNKTGQACLTYVSLVRDDQLSQMISTNLNIQPVSSGSGKIHLSKGSAIGNIEGDEYAIEHTPTSYTIGNINVPQSEIVTQEKSMNIIEKIIAFVKTTFSRILRE